MSFSITLEKQYAGFLNPPTYRIHMDYGALNTVEGVVGISPGFGIGGRGTPPGLPLNLSVSSNTLAPTLTAYEAFSPANAIDLAGSRVTWELGTNGAPTVQN